MNHEELRPIIQKFIETRDVAPLREAYEEHVRSAFSQYTHCQYGWIGEQQFADEFFKRIQTEPYDGKEPANWIWRVVIRMLRKAKRRGMSPATEVVLQAALVERDAILAIDVGYEYEEPERWCADEHRLKIWYREQCKIDGTAGQLLGVLWNHIDFSLIRKRLAA